jgi:hypothetical protein
MQRRNLGRVAVSRSCRMVRYRKGSGCVICFSQLAGLFAPMVICMKGSWLMGKSMGRVS